MRRQHHRQLSCPTVNNNKDNARTSIIRDGLWLGLKDGDIAIGKLGIQLKPSLTF
jgi:hypothetical protein